MQLILKQYGCKLIAARRLIGLTKAELHRQSEVSYTDILDLENQRKDSLDGYKSDMLRKLCDFLDIESLEVEEDEAEVLEALLENYSERSILITGHLLDYCFQHNLRPSEIDVSKYYGLRLMAERQVQGRSRKELAYTIHTSYSHYIMYEHGTRYAPVTLTKMARALELPGYMYDDNEVDDVEDLLKLDMYIIFFASELILKQIMK